MIKEALGLLREEWRDEFNLMVDAVQRGDWAQVWEIAKEHHLLISAVVVPTILFVRYPLRSDADANGRRQRRRGLPRLHG